MSRSLSVLTLALALAVPGRAQWRLPPQPQQAAQPAPSTAPKAAASNATSPKAAGETPASAAPAAVAAKPAPAEAKAASPPAPGLTPREAELRDVAVRFSPVFYQRMAGTVEQHRFDYPTVFDFDGDWIGNNNWKHAADSKYSLWSFIYYSVIESQDYYFIHFAVYHPRDWSTVQGSYDDLLKIAQQQLGGLLDPYRKDIEFNHENDLEGALVIVDKWAGPAVVAVETVAHDHLLRAVSPQATDLRVTSGDRELLETEDGHPLLYIESQKHGIHPWHAQPDNSPLRLGYGLDSGEGPIVELRYGAPTEFSHVKDGKATYELVSLEKTLWKHAVAARQPNTTYGTTMSLGDRFCAVEGAKRPACALGVVGAAFRGDVDRPNSANAPWAWIDKDDPQLPAGAWFFDPALILKRHFGLFDLNETYLYNPYLGIDIGGPAQPEAQAPAAASTGQVQR